MVIRQLLTAAVNKCSGDHIPGIPLLNCGGVATSIHPFSPRTTLISGRTHKDFPVSIPINIHFIIMNINLMLIHGAATKIISCLIKDYFIFIYFTFVF